LAFSGFFMPFLILPPLYSLDVALISG